MRPLLMDSRINLSSNLTSPKLKRQTHQKLSTSFSTSVHLKKNNNNMNKMVYLGCLALASCIGMALGYGSVMTGQKVTGYPYMANMGYGYVPYMTAPSGFGGFLGGTGSSAGGMGMFGSIIQLFLFIFVINILFSSTGLGSGGLGIGKKSSKAGSDYDYYLK